MKKPFYLIVLFLLVLNLVSGLPFVSAAESSSIKNPSIENVSSNGDPIDWQRGGWGDNLSVMTTSNDSHAGSYSLSVSMKSRSSGDAKWMHAPVSVSPGDTYTYSSWYKSNISTEIDLQYTHSDGSVSYAYVADIPPSSRWDQLSVNFTTPADVSRVTVMHIVVNIGWLLVDDVNLSEKATPPVVNDGNLLSNGTLEYSSNSTPLGWNKNSWGANSAIFSYESEGNSSKGSAKVHMTSHTSGDAKWYADIVDIEAGEQYVYSDYYKSDVETWVVAAYANSSGQMSYYGLDAAPASPNTWTQYSSMIKPPSDAKKVIILHVIGQVGELSIDDVDLRILPSLDESSYIANGSLEIAAGNLPHNWRANNWGGNDAVFRYVNNGRTGDKSVKVTVSNYRSGDAKWYFEPTNKLTPGSQYKYSVWYKSNVTPDATVMFIMKDGSYRYNGLQQPKGAVSPNSWQEYTDTFVVPDNAIATSVFFSISKNGWLQTDDYVIKEYSPQGFNRPLLTLTFDDGYEGNAYTALPILNKYNLPSTQCYLTEYPSQKKVDSIMAFVNSGHEICSHTVSHPFLTQLDIADLTYELTASKTYLENITGLPVLNFVSPYGDYNQNVINEVKKYYKSHRSVESGYNSKDNFDRYNIKVQNVLNTTTTAEIAAWVAQAQTDSTWLVLVYHRVIDDPDTYDTSITDFATQMKAISESGITVRTYNNALDEVLQQL